MHIGGKEDGEFRLTRVRSVFNSIGGDTVPQGGNRGKGRGLRRKPMNSVCDILSLRYLQSITWKIQWAAGMWLPRRERGLSYRRAQKTSIRRAEGHMRDHTCIQQVSSGGEPSKDSEREHPGEE